MKQQSLASQVLFEKYGRKSRREVFLDEMDRIVPWSLLEALVRPHYAKVGKGRQPVGLSIMLRTHFVQQWFNLPDPGVEELLYESPILRRFVGVDLGIAPAPDETTVLRFRHLLEQHDLCGMMLDAVNIHLESKGIKIQTGTIVDATIVHAPSSTKNSAGERDPEMHRCPSGSPSIIQMRHHSKIPTPPGRIENNRSAPFQSISESKPDASRNASFTIANGICFANDPSKSEERLTSDGRVASPRRARYARLRQEKASS